MSDWFELWRDSVRDAHWAGTGTVVRKAHRDEIVGDELVAMGNQAVFGSTTVSERWVLVIHDDAEQDDIYLEVEPEVWQAHEVGDQFTTD